MSIGPIEPLITDRLSLEPLRESHAVEMFRVLADPDLYEFTGGSPPSRSSLAERYRTQSQFSLGGDEEWCNWIVRSNADGVAVGFVQATVIGHRADVAWVVGVEHQGQGLATEAARAMVEWLAANGVRRVDAQIHADHLASQRVGAAVGLERTGVIDDDGEEVWSSDQVPRLKG